MRPPAEGPGINVIIPMGGIGSRFRKLGYRFPKPLINIVGTPMINWLISNLRIRPDKDTVYIALDHDVDEEFQLSRLLRKEYPNLNIKTVCCFFFGVHANS